MQHWSGLSARDMLRPNRSARRWVLWQKEGEKTTITLKECHVWEKLVKCGFICLSLETLPVPLTAFWCCHFLVFDVGRIRARPESSLVSNLEFSRIRHCAKYAACIFCCKMRLSDLLHIMVKNATSSATSPAFEVEETVSESVLAAFNARLLLNLALVKNCLVNPLTSSHDYSERL